MLAQKTSEIKRGDHVKILHTAGVVGRVVALLGPLGPKGAQVYRVLIQRKPKPAYVEVLGDQLETVSSVP